MPALPQSDVFGLPAFAILAPGSGLRRKLVQRGFEIAQSIQTGIIPFGIEQYRPCKQLDAGQAALAALDRVAIIGQAPTGIEGLPKDHRLVTRQDRFEPQLGRDDIDRNRALKQFPGADLGITNPDPVGLLIVREMPLPMSLHRFWMGLYQNLRLGMLGLRIVEHLLEAGVIRSAVVDRGIAACLVDHQNIARLWGR